MPNAVSDLLLVTHVDRYGAALGAWHAVQRQPINKEWRTALWLLTCTPGLWAAAEPAIDFRTAVVDFESVSGAQLSRGERSVFALAWHLFDGQAAVDLGSLITVVDDERWTAVLAALACQRGAVADPLQTLPARAPEGHDHE